MKKNDPLVFVIIGAVVGISAWVLVVNVLGGNQFKMMQVMGFKNQNNSSQNSNGMMGNSVDRNFIEEMIPHHEDAIIMADIALQKAEHTEIKSLAANIKTTQGAEIEKMKSWYKNWYGIDVLQNDDSDRSNTGMMGRMHGGMMGNESDVKNLKNTSNFDKAFIEEMIPHHQMAVMMANMLLRGTNRPEMKELARAIIAGQTKEINDMRGWYTSWGY